VSNLCVLCAFALVFLADGSSTGSLGPAFRASPFITVWTGAVMMLLATLLAAAVASL
jgi:hypothetical protein